MPPEPIGFQAFARLAIENLILIVGCTANISKAYAALYTLPPDDASFLDLLASLQSNARQAEQYLHEAIPKTWPCNPPESLPPPQP